MVMMGDRTHVQRSGINHRVGLSWPLTVKSNISHQNSLLVPRVRKVSFSNRRPSLQAKSRYPSIKEVGSVVHVTIRPLTNTVCPTENKLTNSSNHLHLNSGILLDQQHRNESIKSTNNQTSIDSNKIGTQSVNSREYDRQNPFLQQLSSDLSKNTFLHKTSSSITDNTASEYQNIDHKKSILAKEYTLKTTNTTHHPNICKTNFSRFDNGIGLVKAKSTPYSCRRRPTNERNKTTKKRRKCFGGDGCSCTPLCIFLSLLAAFLLGTGIAALLVALIKSPSISSTITTSTRSTTTSTTTSTSSTTTTTVRPIVAITRTGDPIMGLYNTSAGQSTGASNGIYSGAAETPDKAIDGSTGTKYLNFGYQGIVGVIISNPGVNTGFYVSPTISNASLANGLLFATGNDYPDRDPITVTLEGTNVTSTAALDLGSSWTLIYSGSTGIDPLVAPARSVYAPQQNFSNTIVYRSYRLLVTSQRNLSDAVQYAEAEIIGYA